MEVLPLAAVGYRTAMIDRLRGTTRLALLVFAFSSPNAFGQSEDHSKHADHSMPEQAMPGLYGNYPATREASGTSWQPESAPHEGIHAMFGDWTTMTHGVVNLIYDKQGGPRGDTKTFSSSMLMVMGQRRLGDGTLGLRGMVSADPLMGKEGYPLLFQTGETANGTTPLIDRQHPHDLFMELSASYSTPLSDRSSVFVYGGLPGEPALGPPAFMHRFSGEDNPAAPLSHHWLDSTHITYGVVTVGYLYDRFKIEGSVFRGREPDQNRYGIDTGKLDSASFRLSFNPAKDWALQVSHGYLKSPEQLEPDVNVKRTTASAIYNRAGAGYNWQSMLAWGRNAASTGITTHSYLLESAIRFAAVHTLFARAESGSKTELFLDPDPRQHDTFHVVAWTAGYVYDFPLGRHFKLGLGGSVTKYSVPSTLESTYSSDPTSYMVFTRLKIQ